MADKQELIERLQAGIRELTTSERWERWLRMQRRFHRYSWGNVFLIGLQRPDATQVAGFHTWKAMRRSVRKGEKGIAIIAPVVRRTRVQDEDGNVSVVRGSPATFRLAYVFDPLSKDSLRRGHPPRRSAEYTARHRRGRYARRALNGTWVPPRREGPGDRGPG